MLSNYWQVIKLFHPPLDGVKGITVLNELTFLKSKANNSNQTEAVMLCQACQETHIRRRWTREGEFLSPSFQASVRG
jgi:hypothetical protein